jgi:signal transduction histidine kinase
MLKRLHLRLTLLYLLVAMILVALVGGGSYSLLYYYFETTNDMALKFKMAETFESLSAPLPPELIEAEQAWLGRRGLAGFSFSTTGKGLDNEVQAVEGQTETNHVGETYEGELSAIFVYPLDEKGTLLLNPNPYPPPMPPDLEAVLSAKKKGSDLRTSYLQDGTPVRMLTYTLPQEAGFNVLQLGRPFGDQVRVLNQFMLGLLALGGASTLVLGVGSWLLAGRSLKPTQRAWERQQIFVANASHELRTPLTLIRASSEVALRHTRNDSDQKELLSDVINECDHMTQLVEDLLLLSRLDTKELKLERQVIFFPDLIGEVARQFERLANEHSVQLIVKETVGKVMGDQTRLRQVLLILLDNALQHTPAGGTIVISSSLEGRRVRVRIADSGEGIPLEHLPHVFERFYQVKSARSGENRGHGLGLSIAKSLIEAQGGKIAITSQPGKGTEISFALSAI